MAVGIFVAWFGSSFRGIMLFTLYRRPSHCRLPSALVDCVSLQTVNLRGVSRMQPSCSPVLVTDLSCAQGKNCASFAPMMLCGLALLGYLWACRASIPVFTCILAVVVENKIPTKGEATSLVILTLGVMLAVWEGTLQGSPRAILLCIGGTISNAAMMTTSGKVLSERVDALRLTFYTAPISLLALLPAFYLREVKMTYIPIRKCYRNCSSFLLAGMLGICLLFQQLTQILHLPL